MRPKLTWCVAAACLALLGGAMAWLTHSMLGMERRQNEMAEEASLQEMARLALWRMESIAATLVIEESARPVEQFRPFAAPETLLDNKTYATVPAGNFMALSPLLHEPADQVRLHFEMDASGRLSSPQVPQGPYLAMCQTIGIPGDAELTTAASRLKELEALLDSARPASRQQALGTILTPPQALTGNRLLVWSANEWKAEEPRQQPDTAVQTVSKELVNTSPIAQQSVNWKPELAQKQQMDISAMEAQARAVTVDAAVEKVAVKRSATAKNIGGFNSKMAPKSMAKSIDFGSQAPNAVVSQAPVPPVAISEFRPFWLGDALLLTRKVAQGGQEWIQGAWLDWPEIRGELLAAVRDRFPVAEVKPVTNGSSSIPHRLASLPVQLIPGPVAFAAQPFWTPLKVSLSVACACVLLAMAAVALVLRGMMALSERRASFVSSVTHELRTPLATFKLYSEMLADGMVKEETKRRQYLETLTGEADRLGHLVENVLSYSRIERGRGPVSRAEMSVGSLLGRIEPRLNQRALLAGMDFASEVTEGVASQMLRTDAGALEQILCNLVDNACKYGRRDGAPGRVELVVRAERRRVCFTVRDFGPGIPRSEQEAVFRPFHKSAQAAAHSAPGVGLGLALCRRLAAELGGSLEIDRSWNQGAAFVLKLPALSGRS